THNDSRPLGASARDESEGGVEWRRKISISLLIVVATGQKQRSLEILLALKYIANITNGVTALLKLKIKLKKGILILTCRKLRPEFWLNPKNCLWPTATHAVPNARTDADNSSNFTGFNHIVIHDLLHAALLNLIFSILHLMLHDTAWYGMFTDFFVRNTWTAVAESVNVNFIYSLFIIAIDIRYQGVFFVAGTMRLSDLSITKGIGEEIVLLLLAFSSGYYAYYLLAFPIFFTQPIGDAFYFCVGLVVQAATIASYVVLFRIVRRSSVFPEGSTKPRVTKSHCGLEGDDGKCSAGREEI
ncbi:hypothetical protein PRIPAC_88430, partial [Pristionchus pacificus]|uniref:Uncharacterized protein n=1 Tax=Pristionchus pacificus TaxID=54126 RepID=A0A2A6CTE5_PRIPA